MHIQCTIAFSPLKRAWTKGEADFWRSSKRSPLNVSRFLSKKPWAYGSEWESENQREREGGGWEREQRSECYCERNRAVTEAVNKRKDLLNLHFSYYIQQIPGNKPQYIYYYVEVPIVQFVPYLVAFCELGDTNKREVIYVYNRKCGTYKSINAAYAHIVVDIPSEVCYSEGVCLVRYWLQVVRVSAVLIVELFQQGQVCTLRVKIKSIFIVHSTPILYIHYVDI